jgi:hypothetical protein
MTSKSGTDKKSVNTEIRSIIAGTSEEAKQALTEILALERDNLTLKIPSAAKLAREIAEVIRGRVA